MGVIPSYLEAKFGDGGPGSDRFQPDPEEIHASEVSNCQRKHYFQTKKGRVTEASPYFELGRMFEMLYGAALAFEHDPDVTPQVLVNHHPWEVAKKSGYVRQDVGITIHLEDDVKIVGEADWVVLSDPIQLNHVTLHQDGSRTEQSGTLNERDYTESIVKVVETKTTKSIDWKKQYGADEKHKYQVYPYMKAFNSEAEIAYMERNNWDEHIIKVKLPEERWMDCVLRAKKLSEVMQGDEVPAATPLEEMACKWCDFKTECQENGGSKYL